MATCANCTASAVYEYRITTDLKVLYCSAHLPKFLTTQKLAGQLGLTPEPVPTPEPGVLDAPVVDAPKSKAKAKSATS